MAANRVFTRKIWPQLSGPRMVFLDRDGVINRKLPEGQYVTRPEDFELLPGVAETIARLNRFGAKVVVATNQRGVSLGLMTETELDGIHAEMRVQLARDGATLDAIYYCPHGRDACTCRKPGTGMVEAAFRDFPGSTPESSVFIGDSLSDIECGHKAGMATIFITGEENPEKQRKTAGEKAKSLATAVAGSLPEAVRLLAHLSAHQHSD